MKSQIKQGGLSIVELLIALSISGFIVLGVTQVYLNNKKSYAFQQALTRNQDNSRYASLVFDEFLNKAGYRRSIHQLIEEAFPKQSALESCGYFEEGHAVARLKSETENGFCIRYQPAFDNELDCQGNRLQINKDITFAPIEQQETVVLAFRYNSANKSLECSNEKLSPGLYTPIVNEVADIQLKFFVGSNDLFDKAITKSIATKSWSASSGIVRGVGYSLLLSSQASQRDGDSLALNAWGGELAEELKKNDKKNIYKIVTGTRMIRNTLL